jgi:hypothetical protein
MSQHCHILGQPSPKTFGTYAARAQAAGPCIAISVQRRQ